MQSSNWSNGSIAGGGEIGAGVREVVNAFSGLASDISCLIEPLFNLPTRLPANASGEHIPFIFVLIKVLCPKVYVQLGVNDGACLIAASTASKTYKLNMFLYGIDALGDEDQGGDCNENHIHKELDAYLQSSFSNTKLMRCSLPQARDQFAQGSVDILCMDGLHSYDSIKEDFNVWLDSMAPDGVIIIHGIAGDKDGGGIRKFWPELKEQYTTLEFSHACGLGVVLLDPDEVHVAPLRALANDNEAMRVYESMVSLIEGVLPERMGYFSSAEMLARQERLINLLDQTKRRKIFAPLRALKRLWSRKLRG